MSFFSQKRRKKMPVSSIQHRSKIGNYQKKVFLSSAKKIKVFEPSDRKIALEMIGLFKEIKEMLEARKSELFLQTKHSPQITIGNRDVLKISLVLLTVFNQVFFHLDRSLIAINHSRNPLPKGTINSSRNVSSKPSLWSEEMARLI